MKDQTLLLLIIALLLFGIGWEIIVFFENWKYVLTPFGKIVVYWKPSLLILSGAVIFIIIKEKLE